MLRSLRRTLSTTLSAALVLTLSPVALPGAPGASVVTAAASGDLAKLPSENPSNSTPNVLDGEVRSVWQVGNVTVVGGTFTQIQNPGGGTIYDRTNIAAFNSTTGAVLTGFDPRLGNSDGDELNNEVEVVIGAGDGSSVFVGGQFNTVDGTNRRKIARLDVSTGELLAFNAGGINGRVRDLRLIDGTLYAGGLFFNIAGNSRQYLASLDPDTGTLTDKVNLPISGQHNGGATRVIKMEATPDGEKLLITGNFTTISGQSREQIALIDISGSTATLSPWQTDYFTADCLPIFDHYTRDLDISEDGRFALIATTGGYEPDGPCDAISRFELTDESAGLDPTWIAFTGGDTAWSVEIHDGVAYVGGHMRWLNNPFDNDDRGAGGVERTGMGALDLENGVPFSWNPTRLRGEGLFDWHVTSTGIWATSDTTQFAGEDRQRVAFFPWNGGTVVPNPEIGELPNAITQLGRLSGSTGSDDTNVLYRVNAGGSALPAADDGPDWEADTGGGSSYVSGTTSVATAPAGLAVPLLDDDAPKADNDRAHAQLWTTAREGSNAGANMTWTFPIATNNTPLSVRLYFANRDDDTNTNAQREFDVTIDGNTVLTDFDATERVGHDIGTMRSYNINNGSNPNVVIEFIPDIENTMISGIEIVRRGLPDNPSMGAQDDVTRHEFDGDSVSDSTTTPGLYRWSQVRGAFQIADDVYTFHNDGQLMVRDGSGAVPGAGELVDMWSNTMLDDAPTVTGAFFDPETSRIYYTRTGQSQLYSRAFNPESRVIGAERSSRNPSGLDATRVRGMFLGGDGRLYYADSSSGDLRSIAYANGNTSGSSTLVDDSADFRSRAIIRSTDPQPNQSIVPVTPGRILETRPGESTIDGLFEGLGVQGADAVVELQVAGRAGVPADADAAWLNVTAVFPAANGFLTVYPCDEPRPLAANVNYQPGGNYPNAVLAKLSADGKACVYTKSATHIVADINGYVPDGGSPNTVSPARILETRPGESTVDGQAQGQGVVPADGVVQLQVAGRAGVPADADAAMLNVTAVFPAANGFLTLYPCDEPRPLAANVNYQPGGNYPNAVVAKLDATGKTCIYTKSAVHIVADVNGFVPAGASPATVTPARILETRPGESTVDGQAEGAGVVGADGVVQLQVAGRAGVPADATAAMLNVTAVFPAANGFLTLYPCDEPRPLAANVNYQPGGNYPNAVLAKLDATGKTCIYTKSAVHIVADINAYVP